MSAALIDRPKPPRDDDRLDVPAVAAWLAEHIPGLTGTPRVHQYRGGASNLTYLLEWPDREMILRRPPFGTKARSAHDMGREVRFLTALRPHYPALPEVYAHCTDPEVAGGEFYVMERIRGIILRQDLPPELGLDAAQTRRLCEAVLTKLVELHRVDVEAHGLTHLGKGAGYGRRQIEGWSRRYRAALTPGAADGERVMAWLAGHMPPDRATCVIHGDFRFDNVVLDPADPMRIIGVLDWEMATLGDPLMDLGNSLAYWVQADDDAVMQLTRRQPTNAPGMLTRAEVWRFYGEATGLDVSDTDFYEVYGLFRLAVIVQQIFYRYHHGQTTNPAFMGFGELAKVLDARCQAMLDRRGA
ncbi:MAG: phosphotransferase family protein [Alphaproteobacteria bacterium]|nr:phosphotransferase family protein [Alphaproteobacteria bacterium]